MQNHALKQVIEAADRAINREDFDSLMDFYTDSAILVVTPEKNVSGKEQIRKAFVAIAEHFKHSVQVTQGDMIVLDAGDTALVMSHTVVRANNYVAAQVPMDRKATYVFTKSGDGKWRCAIDNSYGTALLKDVLME